VVSVFTFWLSPLRDISALVCFLNVIAFTNPTLVPALQSYWHETHVPGNFIGSVAFAMAALIGIAIYLSQLAF